MQQQYLIIDVEYYDEQQQVVAKYNLIKTLKDMNRENKNISQVVSALQEVYLKMLCISSPLGSFQLTCRKV